MELLSVCLLCAAVGVDRTYMKVSVYCVQLSVWMEGLQKQLSTELCPCPDSVEALQALISQQQQQQQNTQVHTADTYCRYSGTYTFPTR